MLNVKTIFIVLCLSILAACDVAEPKFRNGEVVKFALTGTPVMVLGRSCMQKPCIYRVRDNRLKEYTYVKEFELVRPQNAER